MMRPVMNKGRPKRPLKLQKGHEIRTKIARERMVVRWRCCGGSAGTVTASCTCHRSREALQTAGAEYVGNSFSTVIMSSSSSNN